MEEYNISDKISIILPIFNVGPHLKGGIDSLINQTIGLDKLEIIMVNDCSTDGSGEIINEYAEKYKECIAIHLPKNSGAANKPRNIGISHATGNYIMFLDPDDHYTLDACEVLYKKIKEHNADMVFGRFRRIYTYGELIQKSYSPYEDRLNEIYPNENLEISNPLNVSDFIWNNALKKIVYGMDIERTYSRDKAIDEMYIKNIKEDPDLLKIPPSVWTKIFKREFIENNEIKFPELISGDDLIFTVKALLKAEGIVFLNNFFSYDYYVRDLPDDKSITNTANIRLLSDLLESYIIAGKLAIPYGREIFNIIVNPHLIYWTHLLYTSNMNREESLILLKQLNRLEKIEELGLKTKSIIIILKTMLKKDVALKK